MATLATESWTGANGSAWPAQWTTPDPTSKVFIQGNRGRMICAGAAWTPVRAVLTGMAAVTSTEVTGRFTLVAQGQYPSIAVQASNDDSGDPNLAESCYAVVIQRSEGKAELVRRERQVGGTSVMAPSFAWAAGEYLYRFRAVGGHVQFRAWLASGTEPSTWLIDWTDPAPLTEAGRVRVSQVADVSTPIDHEDMVVTDGTATGSPNAAPTVNAGPDQTSVEPWAPVTLTATAADSDGTVTVAWAQTGGAPTVTLSGTGATRTFEAPGTIAGTTLTFTATATDDDGATATDTMTVTVLPATERAVIGGAEVPMRIRTT